MHISEVAAIINRIADGFESACVDCLSTYKDEVVTVVTEQLYSGIDGEGKNLDPNYDNDPFFEEEGQWHHRNAAYKAWKNQITPPEGSVMLGLPARPSNVPNLFITGLFYSEINAQMQGDTLHLDPGTNNGPSIVGKYGEQILNMSPNGIAYFNRTFMLDAIDRLFRDSGYR